MKTKLTFLALLISITTISQNDINGINYKAIIKDDLGNVLSNTNIDVQIAIEIFTLPIYIETHNVDTNANGLIILNIGEGTVIEGNFENIDWKNDRPDLNVQVDIGNGYVDLGTTPFKYVPFAIRALQVDGLEVVREGGNKGLRLFGADPNNYGDIGESAIDLSYSNLVSTNFGATGDFSVAMGYKTEALGISSTAMGRNTEATEFSSTAMGFNTQASGSYSTALGYSTVASGDNSIAMGIVSTASGSYSTAMGINTRANAFSATTIGRNNIGGGNATEWNDFDPLFEIGNGSSDSNRRNALTVRKDGAHFISSQASGLSINAEHFGLTIANPGLDGIVITNPGDDGIHISSSADDGIQILNSIDNGIEISNSNGNGIQINDSGTNGILVSGSQTYGATITGDSAGIRASSSVPLNPDIILRGNSSANDSDDAIISSDPAYGSSDFYIRSYDGVVVELDYNNNESGSFIVRNGEGDNALEVTEGGNVNMGNRLRLGPVAIEKNDGFSTNFVEINSSFIPRNDDMYALGFIHNRWVEVFSVNGVTNTSDRREKKNIKTLNYGLNEVLKMNPVSFNWKNKNNPDLKLGLIAQELNELIPEVVKTHNWETDEDGNKIKKELDRLGVYYSDLVPVLIKAIQEQQKIIDNEKSINSKQNSQLEALLSRVEQLESNSSN